MHLKRQLSESFPVRSTSESAPVSAKTSLPRAPILTTLNATVGVTQIGPADPPEKCDGADAGEQGDPESHALIVGPQGRAGTDVLTVRGQGDGRSIQPIAEVASINRGM